jgi:hypothetical protein
MYMLIILCILPVFYGMDPSDVQNERGSYGEALAKHKERLKDDIESVNKWRTSPYGFSNPLPCFVLFCFISFIFI